MMSVQRNSRTTVAIAGLIVPYAPAVGTWTEVTTPLPAPVAKPPRKKQAKPYTSKRIRQRGPLKKHLVLTSPPDFTTMTFGQYVLHWRLTRNLTQEQLGQRVGVTHAMIKQYEKNAMMPRYKVMMALAETMQVRPKHLVRLWLEQLELQCIRSPRGSP